MSDVVEGTATEVPVEDPAVAPAVPAEAAGALVRQAHPSREALVPIDPEQVIAGMDAYQALLPRLLNASDYQDAGEGKTFVKKSGWRKIARAFNLSVEIVGLPVVERDEEGLPIRAAVVARAIAPNGQVQDGDGYCSVDEPRFNRPSSRKKIENDLRATATTRAKNRAIADLVGMGEVCLPTRAEILTRAGWRRHDEVEVGDVVLAYDVPADECRWTPLRRISVHEDRPLLRLSCRGFDVTCTPAHKWAVERKSWPGGDPPREMRRADDLVRGEPTIVLAAPAEDGPLDLSARDAALIGWLITDGHIERRGGYVRAIVSQAKEPYRSEVRALVGDDLQREDVAPAGEQEIKGTVYATRECSRFFVKAVSVAALLKRAGIEGKEDCPALATRLSAPARRAMLDAMLKADGTRKPSGAWVFQKASRAVRDTFQILCALEGIALGREQHSDSRAVAQGQRATRYVHGARLKVLPEMPERVWCPSTDYGTWIARLDGQVFVTGNSAEEAEATPPPAAGPPFGDPLPDDPAKREAILGAITYLMDPAQTEPDVAGALAMSAWEKAEKRARGYMPAIVAYSLLDAAMTLKEHLDSMPEAPAEADEGAKS